MQWFSIFTDVRTEVNATHFVVNVFLVGIHRNGIDIKRVGEFSSRQKHPLMSGVVDEGDFVVIHIVIHLCPREGDGTILIVGFCLEIRRWKRCTEVC